MARILWFDNDLDYIGSYCETLKEMGHSITTAGSLSDADAELEKNRFELLILDLMIPTQNEAEEAIYPPETTNRGMDTGIIYYTAWRDRLAKAGTRVLLLTVRPDSRTRDLLKAAGVPTASISTKYNLRNVSDFVAKVESLLTR